jgi:ATP-dependent Zn protease
LALAYLFPDLSPSELSEGLARGDRSRRETSGAQALMPRKRVTAGPRSTATHEAGHAVVGRVLKLPCGHATIVADDDSAGHSITGDQWEILEHWQEQHDKYRSMPVVLRARIIAFMAGAAAEKELLGVPAVGAGEDNRRIAFMGDDVWDTFRDDWLRWEARMRRQTARLVRKHRVKIERVAAALLKRRTLQPHEIDALIDKGA